MVRGGQSKNDSADVDNLFQLTTSAWVSDSQSEKRKETIFNNVWKAGLKSKSQAPYTVACASGFGTTLSCAVSLLALRIR